MYYLDSHGTDVEHFWPKSPYPERMFAWSNLLLGCSECGRLKGDRFPLADGAPLLVNPSAEDPWNDLDFDTDAGNLMARYETSGSISRKGSTTVELLQLDQRESLARVYTRTFLRLCAAVDAAIDSGALAGAPLLERLRELDDHGLLGWCFSERGARHPTFSRLHEGFPEVWAAGVAKFSATSAPH